MCCFISLCLRVITNAFKGKISNVYRPGGLSVVPGNDERSLGSLQCCCVFNQVICDDDDDGDGGSTSTTEVDTARQTLSQILDCNGIHGVDTKRVTMETIE